MWAPTHRVVSPDFRLAAESTDRPTFLLLSKQSVFTDCPCCSGRGVVKTAESMSIEVVRWLMLASQNPEVHRVTVKINDSVAAYLNNRKRRELTGLEEAGNMSVNILGAENSFPEFLEIECLDARGNQVHLPYSAG
jgi:ribonuclease E